MADKRKRTWARFGIGALTWLLLSQPVPAGDQADSMTISGYLADDVSLGISDIDFGDLSTESTTTVTHSSAIRVSAALGLPYAISADAGNHCATCVGAGDRRMASQTDPSKTIGYRLYQDAARTMEWGDAGHSHHGLVKADVGDGSTAYYTVYAEADRVAGGTPIGACSDTLTITVTW